MRRALFAVVLLAGVAFVTDAVLDACGSKFLVGARTARYQRLQAAVHPASILFYWELDMTSTDAEEGSWDDVQAAIEKVGHRIEVANDQAALRSAMRGGQFDIVMMSLTDAKRWRGDVDMLAPNTILLPFVEFPTRPVYSQAKREFGQVLKIPSTMGKLLSTLDKAQQNRGL